MKQARKFLNKAGVSLFLLLIAFSIIKDTVLIRFMSLIWSTTLKTTPEGFISNANVLDIDGLITDYPDDINAYANEKHDMLEEMLTGLVADVFDDEEPADSEFEQGNY